MLYTNGTEVASLKFNAVGSDNLNWFSQSNLAQSPWTDLKNATNLQAFSIAGDARMFEISDDYAGCPNDIGWFLITNHICDWETRLPEASILYSKLEHKAKWEQNGMENSPTLDAVRRLFAPKERCVYTSLIDCPYVLLDFMSTRKGY